jgi:LysM repeat protein
MSRFSQALAFLILATLASSCSSNKKVVGVPSVLPNVGIHGSASTPSHSMSSREYPFAANGDYVQSWAASGGGGPAASDYSSWRSSHHGSTSSRSSSAVRKVSSSSSRKVTSSSSRKKPTSSASRSVRHTVKAGDTLSGIASRYGSSVTKIKSANGLKSDMIRAGRTLVVPK